MAAFDTSGKVCLSNLQALREATLGGEKAVTAWNDAMKALHTFARASGCPLGVDVTKWFTDKTNELSRALDDPFQSPASK